MWMVEDVFHLSNYHVLPEVEEKKQTSIISGGTGGHIILLGGGNFGS